MQYCAFSGTTYVTDDDVGVLYETACVVPLLRYAVIVNADGIPEVKSPTVTVLPLL